jgi:hypothetical protein
VWAGQNCLSTGAYPAGGTKDIFRSSLVTMKEKHRGAFSGRETKTTGLTRNSEQTRRIGWQ